MGYQHTAVVDAPIGEVFAWHTRPGALRRLLPAWQPVRPVRESTSLRDGEAVLGLPGGLRWTARHDPSAYEEGSRFADELTTPVLRRALAWRHVHNFSPDGPDRTRIEDRVETRVPAGLLGEMFAYRARQLSGDLAAHRRHPGSLTVAVTGSSGLIGSALTAFLTTGGHRVVRLVRGPARGTDRRWDPDAPAADLLDGVDALVHLAGESIAGRFTDAHKAAVRDSRLGPTRRLAEVAARTGLPVMVSASAIGWYGPDRGDEELTEDSPGGDGFLADLVAGWEAAADPARQAGVRVVHVRTGIVQSPAGGVLQLLRPLFAAGLGGRLGDGQQWMAWIGIDDMLDIYLRALVDPDLDGTVNAVAPHPVTNAEYTRILARVLHRPALLPVPRFGPELLLGREGASEMAQASQRVVPARLQKIGHTFRHAELEPALRHVLGRTGAA